MVLVGNTTNASVSLPLGYCILNSIAVIGSDSIALKDLDKCITFMENTGIRPSVDPANVMPLDDVSAAHTMLENRQVQGRIVLEVDRNSW